jgi:hypothetical protein
MLAVALAALMPLSGPRGALAQQDEAPLDLPAMVLRPDDLVDQGLEGFGLGFSLLTYQPRTIGEFIEDWGGWDAAFDDRAAFLGADPERVYLLHLSLPAERGDGYSYANALVVPFVMEFGNRRAARQGFDAMAEAWATSITMEEARIAQDLGDDQVLLLGEAINPNSGNAFPRANLLVRADELVAGVVVLDFSRRAGPTAEMVEALGERLLERVEEGRETPNAGLGVSIVRMRVPGEDVWQDYYIVVDGQALRFESHADDDYAQWQEQVAAEGVVDRYYLQQRVAGDFESEEPEAFYEGGIMRFEDEAAAQRTFHDIATNFSPEETVEAPALGDEAMAFRFTVGEGLDSFLKYRVFVRVGAQVFFVSHGTETARADAMGEALEPSDEWMHELAALQLDCIEGEASCAEPLRIPRDVRGKGPAPVRATSGPAFVVHREDE